jgi:hypothetical protein
MAKPRKPDVFERMLASAFPGLPIKEAKGARVNAFGKLIQRGSIVQVASRSTGAAIPGTVGVVLHLTTEAAQDVADVAFDIHSHAHGPSRFWPERKARSHPDALTGACQVERLPVGRLTPIGQASYLPDCNMEWQAGRELRLGGAPVPGQWVRAQLGAPARAGALPSNRWVAEMRRIQQRHRRERDPQVRALLEARMVKLDHLLSDFSHSDRPAPSGRRQRPETEAERHERASREYMAGRAAEQRAGARMARSNAVDRAIIEAAARTLFIDAWAHREEERTEDFNQGNRARPGYRFGPGENIDDAAPAMTPPGARQAAHLWAGRMMAANGGRPLSYFLRVARAADAVKATPSIGRSWDPLYGGNEDRYIEMFGHYLIMQAMGHGVGWFDDHEEFPIEIVDAEYNL